MENGGYSHLITLHFCCLFLLTLFPTPEWGPSHRIQSFTKCSNVGLSVDLQLFRNCFIMAPFYGVQYFRNRVFQRESPMGHRPCGCSFAWVSPPARRLLQCGLCMGCSFLQDTSIYSVGAGTQPASLWSCHRQQRNFCSGSWNTSSLSLIDPGAAGLILFHLNHSSLTAAVQCFLPFFEHISHRCCQ